MTRAPSERGDAGMCHVPAGPMCAALYGGGGGEIPACAPRQDGRWYFLGGKKCARARCAREKGRVRWHEKLLCRIAASFDEKKSSLIKSMDPWPQKPLDFAAGLILSMPAQMSAPKLHGTRQFVSVMG